MVVAIAKAVEQVVLVTVWIDIPKGIVESVDNCSPSSAVISLITPLSDCTANNSPPIPPLEGETVPLPPARAENFGNGVAVTGAVVFGAPSAATCTAVPPVAEIDSDPLTEVVLLAIDDVEFPFGAEPILTFGLRELMRLTVDVGSMKAWYEEEPLRAVTSEVMNADAVGYLAVETTLLRDVGVPANANNGFEGTFSSDEFVKNKACDRFC